MLIDSVPGSLTVAGTEYEINTDYRVWLKFEMLLSDEVEDSNANLLEIKKLILSHRHRQAVPMKTFKFFVNKKSNSSNQKN